MRPTYQRVYLHGGHVAHLLMPSVLSEGRPGVACGRTPDAPWGWLGTGSREEYEHAQKLRVCRFCDDYLNG